MPMHLVALLMLACLQAHAPKPTTCNPETLTYLYKSARVNELAQQYAQQHPDQQRQFLEEWLDRIIPRERHIPDLRKRPRGGFL